MKAAAEINEVTESDGELPNLVNNSNSQQPIKLTADHLDDMPPLISSNSNDGDSNKQSSKTSSKTSKLIKTNSTETRSGVWKYFTKIKDGDITYDVCQFIKEGRKCSKRFTHHGSTTRMIDHLSFEHKLKEFVSNKPKSQKVITDLNKTFAKYIISSAASFRSIENQYLVGICNEYNIPIPSRKQLVDIINNLYDEINDNITIDLKEYDFLSGTSDGWTPKYLNNSFLSLTLNALDENFEFKSFIVGIKKLNLHDAFSVSKALEQKMNHYGIQDKLKYFAVDNATVMTNACKRLNKEYVGCFNHFLNLIVKRFFNKDLIKNEDENDKDDEFDEYDNDVVTESIFEKEDQISDMLEDHFEDNDDYDYGDDQKNALKYVGKILKKVKKIIILFRKSTQMGEALLKSQHDSKPLVLIMDVKHRWNFTFLMIERYLSLYENVHDLISNDNKHSKKYSKYFLNEKDRSILYGLIKLLKPFR